jgi:hypothetical protein
VSQTSYSHEDPSDIAVGPHEDRLALYASPFSAVFKGEPLQPYANAIATVARSRSGFFGSATFGVAAISERSLTYFVKGSS